MATLRQSYTAPKIVTVGTVVDLTSAGGPNVVDSWQGDTHTAIDWNKHNSAAPEVIESDVLD